TAEEIAARTVTEGLEDVRRVLSRGRGAVIVTGHLGNWEIGAASLAAQGIPLDGFAQMLGNPLVNRAVADARARLGMRVFDRRGAVARALRAVREGRAAGFVADQDARRAGVFVPFFGRPASTYRGPALVAIRAGVPLFLGIALRRPDGRYDVRIEEIETDRSGPTDAAVLRLTAAFTARLEAAIRVAPDQYFWLHRRWKTRPPEELAATGHSITWPGAAEFGPERPESAGDRVGAIAWKSVSRWSGTGALHGAALTRGGRDGSRWCVTGPPAAAAGLCGKGETGGETTVIYICIPSYNEARTVGVLLWKIRQVMAGFHRDYQILVVDDGSTDDTPAVLEPYKRVLPLTVVRNEVRRGYAASLELLLREAVQRATYPRRDVIVTLQADFTDEPEEIPAFVKRIEG